jgi:MoxR-like ATPase
MMTRSRCGQGIAHNDRESTKEETRAPAFGALPDRLATCRNFAARTEPGAAGAAQSTTYRLCGFNQESFLTAKKNALWTFGDATGAQAMRVTVGRGHVTAINAEPFIWRSLFFGDHDWLFVTTAELRPGDVIHFLSEAEHPSLLALTWQYGAPVVICAVAILTLGLWRGSVRFGPLAAVPDGARRSLAEQIRGTGHFAARQEGGDILHAACVRALDEGGGETAFRVSTSHRSGSRRGARTTHRVRSRRVDDGDPSPRLRRDHELASAIALLEALDAVRNLLLRTFCMEHRESDVTADAAAMLDALRTQIGQAVVGQSAVIDQVLVALVASGHVLIEGVPGLGKTLLVAALAQALSLPHARVQFTPDMMPSDITGHAVLDPSNRELRLVRGPVFTQILLADEINRAPAKTQSALLEVMQEYQVTLEGQTLLLPKPFMVLATQNPIETEGHLSACPRRSSIGSCSRSRSAIRPAAEEIAVVVRATDGQAGDELPLANVRPCLDAAAVLALQQRAAQQRVDEQVIDYAVRIVRATRSILRLRPAAARVVRWRSSAERARSRCSRVERLRRPDDVKQVALPALRHRVALAPDALLEGRTANDLLTEIIDTVPAPRM